MTFLNPSLFNVSQNNPLEKVRAFAEHFVKQGCPYEENLLNVEKEFTSLEDVVLYYTQNEFSYQFNSFDCVSFIETVFALCLSDTDSFQEHFEKQLQSLRYHKTPSCFLNRNHFFSLQWLPNNKSFFKDITAELGKEVREAETTITYKKWLLTTPPLSIFLETHPEEEKNVWGAFKEAGYTFEDQEAYISYMPTKTFLESIEEILPHLPEAFLVTIVRPNWDLRDKIGTHLNVSHTGIGIKEEGDLYLLHASSIHKKLVKVSLREYMETYKDTDKTTVGGLNFSAFCPATPQHE